MKNAISAAFWLAVMSIFWMFAGNTWGGTLLAIAVTAFVVLAIVAIVDLIG